MTTTEYQEMALRTQADQDKILKRMYSGPLSMMQADNACRGLIADAGEVAGCIQKWIEYGRDLDKVNLMEELGDCLWRIAQMCDAMNWSLEDVMQANIIKLQARYPLKYSDHQANNRDIPREVEALQQTGQGWAEPSLPDDLDTPSSHLTPKDL